MFIADKDITLANKVTRIPLETIQKLLVLRLRGRKTKTIAKELGVSEAFINMQWRRHTGIKTKKRPRCVTCQILLKKDEHKLCNNCYERTI